MRNDLLGLVLLLGAFGAPLIGPLRETVQGLTGLSRFQLGAGVFLLGIASGILGIAAVRRLRRRWARPRFVRWGAALLALGCLGLAALPPAPGWPAVLLGLAWFVILLGGAGVGLANPMIADLYRSSGAHSGVILLHAANALGKVAAPLFVLLLGASLRLNGAIYAGLAAFMCLRCLKWPPRVVSSLEVVEQEQDASASPHAMTTTGRLFFWAAAFQFAIIAGAEAGVTSILGSFIYVQRQSPIRGVDAAGWAAAVVLALQAGIAGGRFVFFHLSRRMDAPRIAAACLPFIVFAVPLAWGTSPWLYAPSGLLLGVAFSATWPAFFAVADHCFPDQRSAFTMAARLCTIAGVNGCILLASWIGNRDADLGTAVLAGAGLMLVFALFLASPLGRRMTAVYRAEAREE